MEENTNIEQVTQADNMGNDTDVQGTSGKEKVFTQEEVNSFVQNRVNRLKGQLSKEAKAEYDQKMAELQAREMKLLVKERLSDRGMSKELADIITCTDEKDIDAKLDALQKIYGEKKEVKETPIGFVQVGGPPAAPGADRADPVRKAMGLN